MLLFLSNYLLFREAIKVPWMISEHVFIRLTFAFDMCSYNILKTMLVLFYPVLVERIADILVYLTASTTSTSSAGNNSMKIGLGCT